MIETVKEAKDLKVKIDVAKDIVQSMGELKGAFMKMGQMLSISDDLLLPPEISELFKELQKNAPPMPRSDLDKVSKELWKKYQKVYLNPLKESYGSG